VNGLQYGITSAGDNPMTGNQAVTGSNALIHNSVIFTLGSLPVGFNLSSISNVRFQYGTALTDISFPGTPGTAVPEAPTMALIGFGLLGIRLARLRAGRRPR
jgi:hypothetical protein